MLELIQKSEQQQQKIIEMRDHNEQKMNKLIIQRKFRSAAVTIQAMWRMYIKRKFYTSWKPKYMSIIRFLQLKFKNRLAKKKAAVLKLIRCLKANVQRRKEQKLSVAKHNFVKEALKIYKKKIKPSKPTFISRKRSKKFGSGPFDLKKPFMHALMMTKSVKAIKESINEKHEKFITNAEMTLYQNPLTPVKPIMKAHDIYSTASPSQTTKKYDESPVDFEEYLSDDSLPTHISEIEPPEPFDVDKFVKEMRKEHMKYDILDKNDLLQLEEDDKTQYPLYMRLNKLRKMREENAKKEVI